ncbi:MAG: hypothetical protein NTW86_07285 [Candidatus Sumerlaeota bacterium]|nr:hypothetical protein [Candidatus Sumerlaeota bacterium]
MIAGGLGAAALGLATTLAEASERIMNALAWWTPAGPLSGAMVFFAAWAALHSIFRGKSVNFLWATVIAFVLLGLGLVGTFPPFYGLFAAK